MSTTTKFSWRLNAGDEHTVMDERNQRLVSVPCGGMTGRTLAEAAEIARLIAAAPELYEALNDLLTASQPQRSDRPGFIYLEEAQERAHAALAKVEAPRG